MDEKEHTFYVKNEKDGITIYSKDSKRKGCRIKLNKQGFWELNNWTVPLYCFRNLLEYAVDVLYIDWERPEKYKKSKIEFKIKEWAKGVTGKSINHIFLDAWRGCIQTVDPRTEKAHRLLFSSSGGRGNMHRLQEILESEDNYYLDDIIKYDAARIPLLWAWDFTSDRNWMDYFSNQGKYRSLTRTLMNLPGNIMKPSLLDLKENVLPEPATNRFRLMAYLALFRKSWFGVGIEDKSNVIIRSSDNDIKNAILYMRHYFPNEKNQNLRSSSEIMRTLDMIFDYAGSWDKLDMMGLAKRSEKYHHDRQLQIRLQEEAWEAQSKKRAEELEKLKISDTALPRIALPDNPNIKFLRTFQAVVQEGELMNHCIATYAERAVKGKCYLFHVDYAGEMASVEVSPGGYVQQSYGPKDTSNKASDYGRIVLSAWAKGLQVK